ncbi:hypothetical protein C5167_017321 [Papaver somniferum]|uniref:Uncharacterized protein n=1 Tax=Papaver somniferum TaxID=3469 RepID=A0A4Y7IN41_PAPSO|nr:hypothetical protein C5167_017321 [Papaver somniferum]
MLKIDWELQVMDVMEWMQVELVLQLQVMALVALGYGYRQQESGKHWVAGVAAVVFEQLRLVNGWFIAKLIRVMFGGRIIGIIINSVRKQIGDSTRPFNSDEGLK